MHKPPTWRAGCSDQWRVSQMEDFDSTLIRRGRKASTFADMVEFTQDFAALAGRNALKRFGARRDEDAEGADGPVAVRLSEVVRNQQKARLAEGVTEQQRRRPQRRPAR